MSASDELRPFSGAGHRAGITARLLDRLVTLAVLALAFLLALLPARNSDLWLHLASGRLLAQGQYSFGVDPFAFTTAGVRWVNASWLYDLLSYLLFQWGGGAALVLSKAGLMALLGWTLIRLSRTPAGRESSRNGWTASVFAVLAVVVVGSSMALRPILVSYLFLALTLWLLEARLTANRPSALAAWWPLPLLFALWANLDAWFLLGPLTVGLFALGSLRTNREGNGQARQLGLVFLAGLAACLLNPHHYHIFALPLLPFTDEATILRDDPLFRRILQSPFQRNYLRFRDIPHLGRLLYYLLVLLGLASFLFNGVAARSGGPPALWMCFRRLPTWLVFFALSALDASAIPFMAIVSAPLTALNFQEYLRWREAKRSAVRPPSRLGTIGGRIVALTIVVGLPIVAWPGWLQGQLRERRGWTIEIDSSLVDAVRQAARWRREGHIRDRETGFNFSPTAAHYFAWFAPEEKGFYDSRWSLCAPAAREYVTVRRALLGDVSAIAAARRILRQHHVNHLVLHDSDASWTAGVFQHLVNEPGEWPILFLKGDTVVLGWRDPARSNEPDRFADRRVDFQRRAFQPSEEERAPARGPSREPNAFGWRSYWTLSTDPPSHAGEEAALYLIYFDTFRPSFTSRHRAVWQYSLAALFAVPTPSLPALTSQFLDFAAFQVGQKGPQQRPEGGVRPLDVLAMQSADNYGRNQDDGPVGLLLLAVRAARRAVRDNPDDARAYQLLGEAYLHLMQNSRERAWKADLPSLAHIRQIQAAWALHQALLLRPDLIQPHMDLFVLYRDMGLLDFALRHARQVLHLTRTRGEFAGESREAWAERLQRMEESVDRLDEEVQRRLNHYDIHAVRRSVFEQAVLAREQGLGGKALAILLASDVAVFGKRGTELELDLLLAGGRIQEAREWMAPGQGVDLSNDSSQRFRILIAAAVGDYRTCDEEIVQLAAPFNRPVTMVFDAWKVAPLIRERTTAPVEKFGARLKVSPRQALSLKVAQLLLEMPLQRQTIPWLLTVQVEKAELLESLQTILAPIRQQAEWDVLRAALALERGEVPQAESFLRRALSVWRSEANAALDGGLDFAGRRTAAGLLEWLSRPQGRSAIASP